MHSGSSKLIKQPHNITRSHLKSSLAQEPLGYIFKDDQIGK